MNVERSLTTSVDGQWTATRHGRDVPLLAAGAGPPVGQLTLDGDDVDISFVGPPTVLVSVVRQADATKIVLHQPPYLDASARLDLDMPARLAALTVPRMVLVSTDGKQVTIVRAAGRALSAQTIDVGGPVELAVGLDRNQVLFAVLRKLEVWDAVSGRPLLRLQLQLPPPPRTVGVAAGHLWVTRPESDELFVFRLSDGRPFRHEIGAPIEAVISHPASPVLVVVTPRGLVRLHCLAHSLHAIDAPWIPGLGAHFKTGIDLRLLGLAADASEPWRVAIGGPGPNATGEAMATEPSPRASIDGRPARTAEPRPAARVSGWREPLVAYAAELVRGADGEMPIVAVDTELGELAHRLALPAPARRALIALYGAYLIGEPALAIARLSRALGDWGEPLGQGELGALAMLSKHGGKVALRTAVTDILDGAPRTIRASRRKATSPRRDATLRDGRGDAALESAHHRARRTAVLEGGAAAGLLESRPSANRGHALPPNRPWLALTRRSSSSAIGPPPWAAPCRVRRVISFVTCAGLRFLSVRSSGVRGWLDKSDATDRTCPSRPRPGDVGCNAALIVDRNASASALS
jgi:hypothetical protein